MNGTSAGIGVGASIVTVSTYGALVSHAPAFVLTAAVSALGYGAFIAAAARRAAPAREDGGASVSG